MSLATIRDALKTALESVTDVGVVTTFEPALVREEDLRTYFQPSGTDYLQGWTITRESTPERDKDTESNWRDHLIVIRGYRTLQGDSERDFQDLIEAVCARLRNEQRDQLSGTVTFCGPPNVRLIEARTYGGYLVHYVEVTLRCTEAVWLT